VIGNFSCSDGSSGPFGLTNIEVSQQGFLGQITQISGTCAMNGNLGGARATVNQAPD